MPIPTSGVTMPPKRKPVAPTKADTQPVAQLPSVMATVVDAGKRMPTQKRIMNTTTL